MAYQTQKAHFRPQYQLKQSLGQIKKCRQIKKWTSGLGRGGNEVHTIATTPEITLYLSLVFPGSLSQSSTSPMATSQMS